ncbi:MAG TPA: ankyrin repeat domain-containing protein [Coriobacteriia bacterium]|nr:ankyrin repeat domain-containing protein [Coriobacteriia bacterium]
MNDDTGGVVEPRSGTEQMPWMMREMIEDPANFERVMNPNNGIILDAVVSGDVDGVREVLANGPLMELIDVETRWEDKMTVLHLAAALDHPDIVQALVEGGLSVEAKALEGMTPLLVAAVNDRRAAVERLLDLHANIEAVDIEQGASALNFAAFYGYNELARLLLGRGANPNHMNYLGTPPLQTAVAQGNIDLVRTLLDNGARTSLCSGGLTLVFIASQEGHADIVRLLVEHGADPNARRPAEFDYFGPLHAAVRGGHGAVLDALAAAGADLNLGATHGVTPLIIASAERKPAMAEALIRLGADPDRPDAEGWRPLDYAKRNNDSEMARVLTNTPRGTAVASAAQSVAAAGWFEDPTGRHGHRYWDGAKWTHFVADAGVQSEDPI